MTLNDSTGSVQEIMGWTLVGLNITHHSFNRVSSRGKRGKVCKEGIFGKHRGSKH